MVSVAAVAIPSDVAPGPRAGVTVEGLADGEHVITIWRRSDGEREAVQGARRIVVVDSFYVEDFKAPFNRPVTYEVEIISGANAGMQGLTYTVTVPSRTGWIHDPLAPSTAVPVIGTHSQGETYLRPDTFSTIHYRAQTNLFPIMGSAKPVAIGGVRQAPAGIPIAMSTKAEAENTALRDMVRGASFLVIRPLPEWGASMPGTATYAAEDIEEQPVTVAMGGSLTRWETTGDVVRGSSARVLIALWTYQEVAEMFATYDQKQAAAGSGTYLDDLKNPANA